MKDLVSVIVPIYKVEEYLQNCIDSILKQSHRNMEIILVDDGSPDNCGRICDEYATKDSRIKVIHKENGGLSDARNAGIRIALGDYITCIDSDDYISSDFIEYLLNLLVYNKADISICGFIKTARMNEQEQPGGDIIQLYSNQNALCEMLYAKVFTTSAWGKLYKSELFRDIEYPIGKYSEDMFTTYRLMEKCDKIVYGNKVCYYYLRRANSILTGQISKRHIDVFEALHIIREIIPFNSTELEKAYKSQMVSSMAELLEKNPPDEFVVDSGLWNETKKYMIPVLTNRYASIRVRAQALLMLFGRRIAKWIIIKYYNQKWK